MDISVDFRLYRIKKFIQRAVMLEHLALFEGDYTWLLGGVTYNLNDLLAMQRHGWATAFLDECMLDKGICVLREVARYRSSGSLITMPEWLFWFEWQRIHNGESNSTQRAIMKAMLVEHPQFEKGWLIHESAYSIYYVNHRYLAGKIDKEKAQDEYDCGNTADDFNLYPWDQAG